MAKIRVAIVGVGNCASSLMQGIEFYREASGDAAIMLGPFAMRPALPAPDYYGPSAPPRPRQPTTGLPTLHPGRAAGRDHRDGTHVHREPFDGVGAQLYPCGLATPTPQHFSVASLPATSNRPRSRPPSRRACTASQPRSARFELVAT